MDQDTSGFDMTAHRHTYDRFIGLFKWGTVAVAVFVAAVVAIIAR